MNERLSSQSEVLQLPKAPVPLIADTLKVLSEHGLKPIIELAAYQCDQANINPAKSYLLSLACRQIGDQTGILGPLIGVSQGPEDTRKILIGIEQQLLGKLDDELKQKVFTALNKGKIAGAETILTIDELLGEAVGKVRQVAIERDLAKQEFKNMTEEAFEFWLKNRLQLDQLLKQETNGDIFKLLQRNEVREGMYGDQLTNITQTPIIPVIPTERAQLLQAILPEEINRQNNSQPPAIDQPLGFISRLNMAGSDLFRYLASHLRERTEAENGLFRISNMP
jgi:hypothetical protein